MLRKIDGPDAMIEIVRRMGLIPFFRNPVHGWSIEEMTAPGCWFDADGVLGPWDWKIDVVRSGMAYGKFLGGRAAFATERWYRELMNYRRSLPKYKVEHGGILAKPAYDAILEAGSLESRQLRRVLSEHSGSPVKKNVSDTVLTFLQMGTWCLTGDFERVYRGPDLVYSGWQLSSNTTPEQFWGEGSLSPAGHVDRPADEVTPSWAWRLEEEDAAPVISNLGSPEESRQRIIDHVLEMFPDADIKVLEKMI